MVTGDSWASNVARSMFDAEALAANQINTDVAVFFVSYIFIGSVVLFNGLCACFKCLRMCRQETKP